jgi:hypothetical protein
MEFYEDFNRGSENEQGCRGDLFDNRDYEFYTALKNDKGCIKEGMIAAHLLSTYHFMRSGVCIPSLLHRNASASNTI